MKRLIVLVALLAACAPDSSENDIASQFRETPLRALRGVSIGMTARQIKIARPAVRYAPLTGVREFIQEYEVAYQFPNAMTQASDSDVPPDDRLTGVFMTRLFPTYEGAQQFWREQVTALTAAHHAPGGCVDFASGPTSGTQARWNAGRISLVIGAFKADPNAPQAGNRVVFAIAQSDAIRQPAGGRIVDCPTS